MSIVGTTGKLSSPVIKRSTKYRFRMFNRGRGRYGDMKMMKKMEMKNLELYMKNMSVMEANKKLKKKAEILHQENQVLMSELIQKKLFNF
ncbi:protein LITTLE ZIPPER 1-like [Impatiens glandulifera]|uniref:protein LITTLE ZIPPER 1-like n=1 Tax=Impatiens glandulifera TaxID=253017 RepID=UPI001FB15A96|nr:protein LITTLE ZIPPER 1-like [Impatiens glandulifera]